MEKEKGWVKIHRKLLENPISSKPEYFSVWVHLLLMANHKPTSFIWNCKKQELKEGQLLTGLKALSRETGVSQGTLYRILKYLEREGQIKMQTTTKYTVITILNWEKYQENEKQNEMKMKWKCNENEKQNEKQTERENVIVSIQNQDMPLENEKQNEKQMKNKWKTNEKQMKTYKNIKNDINIYKTISKDIGKPKLEGEMVNTSKEKAQTYGNADINTCIQYLQEKLGASLDGSVKENRQYCYNLLRKMKKDYPNVEPVEQVKMLIDIAMQDRFHRRNVTGFKYLYYNTQRIAQSFKGDYGIGENNSDIQVI